MADSLDAPLHDYDDVAPFRYPFKVKGERYVLNEPSSDDGRVWKNYFASAAKFDSKGKFLRAENVADNELLLVGRCASPMAEGGGPKLDRNNVPVPVGRDTVAKWPARVVKDLFEKLVEVGDLREKETAPELRKRIAELQRKLDKLEPADGKAAAGADDPKAGG